jgi:hypothetical protein
MTFQVDDAVRVVRLIVPEREVAVASDDAPLPHVGDEGVVVADVGDGYFLIECRTDDGVTRWTAEFAAKELLLVDRPDEG